MTVSFQIEDEVFILPIEAGGKIVGIREDDKGDLLVDVKPYNVYGPYGLIENYICRDFELQLRKVEN